MVSTLGGIYDVFTSFGMLSALDDAVPRESPFTVEVVALEPGPLKTASGLPFSVNRSFRDVEKTDIVILPSMMVADSEWVTGRYPAEVRWLADMHSKGAMICSACSGVLLMAETGLLNGLEATVHWAYGRTFRENFPGVKLRLEEVLVASGERKEFVMSGASASWHDLVLYLIARRIGPTAAQALARFMLLQWHTDGQAPYVAFNPPTDHGDAVVLKLQGWLRSNLAAASPVEEMAAVSGIPERTFKRRFTTATGLSPISYVQRLRIEEAKKRLERTDAAIEEISRVVGYEDPAFFRRLFKRTTNMTPGDYRRKFQLPDLPMPAAR
jgi:transcriptional regulator GlxA family with amidase domain